MENLGGLVPRDIFPETITVDLRNKADFYRSLTAWVNTKVVVMVVRYFGFKAAHTFNKFGVLFLKLYYLLFESLSLVLDEGKPLLQNDSRPTLGDHLLNGFNEVVQHF